MQGLKLSLKQDLPIPLDVSFACQPGEVVALVGPSGSGKSTILRSIAGTYRPKSGKIVCTGATWVDTDKGVQVPAHLRSVGMVFQNYALFPHMSAIENVIAGLGHLPRQQRASRARELLELVRLTGFEDRRPSMQSGGQQQRIAVARALARDPAVLLLDEPFSAVDQATRKRLYREIAVLQNTWKMPVILVTHDIDEATLLADRIAILHRGQLQQIGSPDEVLLKPISTDVARLLDIRNVFGATTVAGNQGRETILLDWQGIHLEATSNAEFAINQPVQWIIPDGFVILHRRNRPSRGEHENPIAGTIGSYVSIGQTAHLTLIPDHDKALPIHFSVPKHVAQRNDIRPGVGATVSLLADGIHIVGRAPAEFDESALPRDY